jgi:hypothetical protein
MDERTDMHMNATESMWYHMKASLNTIGKANTYIISHSICSRNNAQYRTSPKFIKFMLIIRQLNWSRAEK